ncbi:hypothetical protein MBLNU13_g01801t1 [Cladosporium sp. NU13]
MQAAGDLNDAEAAAAHAERQARAQAQVAMSDLGTASTRNSEAYMAQTDSRGNLVCSNAFQDAQTAAQVQNRRAQLQASTNSATAAWNNPNAIPGSNPQDLGDLFGGQGHRSQFTHAAASVRADPATIPRIPTGPRAAGNPPRRPAGNPPRRPAGNPPRGPAGNPPRGPAAALASSSTRQRAGSPIAHSTIRTVGGHHQDLRLPIRHRQLARDGSFAETVPGAPRIPARQPIIQADHASGSSGHDSDSPGPVPGAPRFNHVQPVLPAPQAPQAPRLAPVQPVLQVPQGPLQTPDQPFSQVPLAGDLPAPLRIKRALQQHVSHVNPQAPAANQATRQPTNGTISSGPAERDQQRINTIFEAVGTDDLLVLMASSSQDGAQIFSAKVHVRACAVETSKPSDMVISKGPLWIAIFHAVRKALITLAIEITLMVEGDGLEMLRLTKEKYHDFHHLFRDVLQARAVVKKSIESEQAIQDKWASAGKKDILDEVIEKEAALTAQMELETSIQQSSERFNPQVSTTQQYGISTTIAGPVTLVRKTVQFTPADGYVDIGDGDHHWCVSRKGLEPDQHPPGLITSITLVLDQHLNIGDLPGAYVAALKAAADSLINISEVSVDEPSDEEL